MYFSLTEKVQKTFGQEIKTSFEIAISKHDLNSFSGAMSANMLYFDTKEEAVKALDEMRRWTDQAYFDLKNS